jgi:hypothetical protein
MGTLVEFWLSFAVYVNLLQPVQVVYKEQREIFKLTSSFSEFIAAKGYPENILCEFCLGNKHK